MKFFLIPLAIFSFILILSCAEKKSIDENKLIKVYADLIIIQDTTKTENYSLDSLRTIVLDRYNLTYADYKEMIDVLNQQPEKWEKFFNNAVAYVNKLKTKEAE